MLAYLDRVEGAPTLFVLAPVEIDGVEEPVWTYHYQREARGRPLIESGKWDNR